MLNQTVPEIYLDSNATTPVCPQAAQEAFNAMEDLFGNPSSSHITGLRARSILESARTMAQSVLGAHSGRVVFTSGATEAIQSAVFSALYAARRRQKEETENSTASPGLLLYGATEHKAVPQALQHWNEVLDLEAQVVAIPVDERGALDLNFLNRMADRALIVCTMAVNNETGVITDLPAVERAIGGPEHKAYWLVDCVQAVGKLPLELSTTSVDYAPVSGHKIYAPKGIGLLYVREEAPLTPLLAGGGQEGGARGGTENLPGVAAISHILQTLEQSASRTFTDETRLIEFRDRLVAALRTAFPTIEFNTPFETAVPTTINFSVEGFTSKEILDLFDAASIRVSSGSACGSALVGSFVLEAMGLPAWRAQGAIRMSFGPLTPESDIRSAEARIVEAGKALAESCLMIAPDVQSAQKLDGLVQLKRGSDCSWVLLDRNSRRCIVIDPFEELANRIATLVRCQGSRVVAVLDSHCHVDHDSCRTELVTALSDFTEPSADTNDILGWPEQCDGSVKLSNGEDAEFIRLSSKLIMAKTCLPGHTAIGCAFLVGEPVDSELPSDRVRLAFTGDTLLVGGIGRTDFSSSSPDDMLSSLRKLNTVASLRTLICPTHDYRSDFATTLGAELKRNQLLSSIVEPKSPVTLDDFLNEKASVDNDIDDAGNHELVCGFISARDESYAVDIGPLELPDFFSRHVNSVIVDVREPHEFRFAQDWSALGLAQPPENIPLTRLSDFLSRLLNEDEQQDRDIIFLCRSGSRSGKAAHVARRLGFERVWHIKGGIALGIQRESLEPDDMEFVI